MEKCFALNDENACMALTEDTCPGFEKCRFYKSVSEAKAVDRTSNDRVVSLPYERRTNIARKYYAGKMQWEDTPNGR